LPALNYFEGWHDGFERLSPGLRHERAVLFVRSGYWVIRDRIHGAAGAQGRVSAHFQFAAGLGARVLDSSTLEVTDRVGRSRAVLMSLSGHGWESAEGRVSPTYGIIRDAPAWMCSVPPPTDSEQPVEILTLIARSTHRIRPLVTELGAAWALGETGDLLIVQTGGVARLSTAAGQLETDSEWLWIGRRERGARPDLFLVGGDVPRLDGRPLVVRPTDQRATWVEGEPRARDRGDRSCREREEGPATTGDWVDAASRDALGAWWSSA